jgi:xylitol oxidase
MDNWAGTYTYRAARIERPGTVEALADLVRSADRVHAVGTRHCFNAIADAPGGLLISTEQLNRIVSLDTAGAHPTVTIESGVTYGQLGPVLHAAGWALPNLASLPHISVAGSVATATHGSGQTLGCLSTSVSAMEFITADGTTRTLRWGDADFNGAVVHLGVLGVVGRLTLELVPTFDVEQTVYEGVSIDGFIRQMDAIAGSAYSVSGFTDWHDGRFTQVWMKSLAGRSHFDLRTIGGTPADGPRHPLAVRPGNVASAGAGAAACSVQMGLPGPWHERLPHFRMEFTPSSGAEIQTEYFVPRERAPEALAAIVAMGDAIGPALQVSEVRFIAADDLWMSMAYGRPSVGIHFTWRKEPAAVAALLPRIERALAPLDARPHWGKLFDEAGPLAVRRDAAGVRFDQLRKRMDPGGKFAGALVR